MEKYIYPQNIIELFEAREKGYTIELNGSAINGGYGETWNEYSGDDFGWSLSAYRIVNPDYKIEVSPIIKNNNTFEIEITFKFRIPENNVEVHKDVAEFLRTKINNYDYYNELVRFQVLKDPSDSIINKLDRLEHLERAISLFRESLLPVDEQDIETTNALHNHNKQARETLYKDL